MSKETLTSTFTELRKGFLRLAMRFLPSQEDADDALQEAFFRLWKQADRISSREEAEALTVVTVKNLCIDILRRRSHLWNWTKTETMRWAIRNRKPRKGRSVSGSSKES